MFSSPEHKENIINAVKKEMFSRSIFEARDVVVVCMNGEKVRTWKNMLCIFSPLMREVFGSIMNPQLETFVVCMPQFKKQTIEKLMMIVQLDWLDNVLLDDNDVECIRSLNMCFEVSSFGSGLCELPNTYVEGSQLSSNETPIDSQSKLVVHDIKSEETIIINNANVQCNNFGNISQVSSNEGFCSTSSMVRVKEEMHCPVCRKTFSAAPGLLRNLLRTHIGLVHRTEEMENEVRNYFGDSKECNKCGKSFENDNAIKKHLVYNHSSLMSKVRKSVQRLFKLKNLNQKNREDELLFNDNKVVQDLNDNQANQNVLKCYFKCSAVWRLSSNPGKLKYRVRLHLSAHFKEIFDEKQRLYILGQKCNICGINLGSKSFSIRRHLLMKHDVCKDEIETCINNIFGEYQFSADIGSMDELNSKELLVDEEEKTAIQRNIMKDISDDESE